MEDPFGRALIVARSPEIGEIERPAGECGLRHQMRQPQQQAEFKT
jgi:hypothetical protein